MWTLELGDWDGGMALGYMSFGFFVEERGEGRILTPGMIDLAAEKWAKRYSQSKPEITEDSRITESSVKYNAFISNTDARLGTPRYGIYKNSTITFGYATRSYVDDDEWIYGWVTFVFVDGVPYERDGCYVYGADGIYAGTGFIIPRQIPEPGTVSLVLFGIVMVSLRRRQGI